MAMLNRTALFEYDVAGPVVIHERAILQHVAGDESYAILMPDIDMYIEEMAVTNSDLRSFRLRPAPGVLPIDDVGSTLRMFDHDDDDDDHDDDDGGRD